jgi:hypothetical protein
MTSGRDCLVAGAVVLVLFLAEVFDRAKASGSIDGLEAIDFDCRL